MRIPEPSPLGDTFSEARERAMVAALLVNNPWGGWVESVLTLATQRLFGLRVLAVLLFFARICITPFPFDAIE